jgi:hypothetical protein
VDKIKGTQHSESWEPQVALVMAVLCVRTGNCLGNWITIDCSCTMELVLVLTETQITPSRKWCPQCGCDYVCQLITIRAPHCRTRHLICERQSCEEFMILHLGFLDYTRYMLTVRFHGLESFHQRYNIEEVTFFVSNYVIYVFTKPWIKIINFHVHLFLWMPWRWSLDIGPVLLDLVTRQR